MKIALIIRTFSLHKGGAERYAIRLAEGLHEEHEVHVFTSQWDDSAVAGLIFHRVPTGRGPAFLKLLRFHWGCRRQIRGEHFDVVHALAQTYPVDVYRMSDGLFRHWLSLQYPNRLQRLLRCLLRPVYFFNLAAEKKILKEGGARLLIANSDLCRRQAIDDYSVSPDRIDRVYNSVDLKTFHPGVKRFRSQIRKEYGIDPDAPLLLFSAMNFSRKGLAELIKSLAEVSASFPNVRVMILGKGDPRPYRKLARTLGVEERLIFTGPVKDPAPYYGAADLFVLPTHYDPFANVCLEAMASGLPVVTTRQNGASELIEEGVNGHTVESADQIDGLAEKIGLALLSHLNMGGKAAETARSFSQADHIQKVVESYKRVVSGKIPIETIPGSPPLAVNGTFISPLEKSNLLSYDNIMAYTAGILLKRIHARTIIKFTLTDGHQEKEFYLKKHHPSFSFSSVLGRSEGKGEWNNIVAFHQAGLPTMIPVAMGEKRSYILGESFLLTEAIVGYESLETWLPVNLALLPDKEKFHLKRELIKQVALLTRKMHHAGFYHRDFYLTHLLVKRLPQGFDLKIIDLQRGIRYPLLKKRWKIKDLASLNYSTSRLIVTERDRLRFYKWYRGTAKLGEEDRFLIKKIERKTKRIDQHTGKRYQERQERKRLGLLGR